MNRQMAIAAILVLMMVPTALLVFDTDGSEADQEDRIEVSFNHGRLVDASTGQDYDGGTFVDPITLRFIPNRGYEIISWIVDGDAVYSMNADTLILSSVNGDVSISPILRNYSTSQELINIVDVDDLPDSEDELVLAWSFKSTLLDKSGGMWTGMPCTPLIVDHVAYVRAGPRLYALDMESGSIINFVTSTGYTVDYYHYLSYGNGIIFDTVGYKAYDLDLNYLYDIPSNLRFVSYHEGYFYGCLDVGSSYYTMYKTSADRDSDLVNNVKQNLFTSSARFNVFAQYGQFSNVLFIGDWFFFLQADMHTGAVGYRAISAFNIKTEVSVTCRLTGFEGMPWDDGWLTYYDGYFYLTAYTAGLFGGVVTGLEDKRSSLMWVKFDFETGAFQEPSYKNIQDPEGNEFRGIASGLVIYNGRGYLNVRALETDTLGGSDDAGSKMIVYEIESNGEPVPRESVSSAMTHGGIVVNTAHAEEGEILIYMLPYNAAGQALYVFTDELSNGVWSLKPRTELAIARTDWCSQCIRAGPDGELLFYVDSGYIDCYVPADKYRINVITVEGGYAQSETACGKNIQDVLKKLYPTIEISGRNATIGGKEYFIYGLNEVTNTWVLVTNPSVGTYSGTYKNGVTESTFRQIVLLEKSSSMTLPEDGQKGWYYFNDGCKKASFSDLSTIKDSIGCAWYYLDAPPSANDVKIKPIEQVNRESSITIALPELMESTYSVSDETVIQVTRVGNMLTVTGLKEDVAILTIEIGGKQYPVSVSVLPKVTIADGITTTESDRTSTVENGTLHIVSVTTESEDRTDKVVSETITDFMGNEISVRNVTESVYGGLTLDGSESDIIERTEKYTVSGNVVADTSYYLEKTTEKPDFGVVLTSTTEALADNVAGTYDITTTLRSEYDAYDIYEVTVSYYSNPTGDGEPDSEESHMAYESKQAGFGISCENGVLTVSIDENGSVDVSALVSAASGDPSVYSIIIRSKDLVNVNSVMSAVEYGATMVMDAGTATITLGAESLKNLTVAEGNVRFSVAEGAKMTPKQQNAAGDALVFSVVLLCGETEQHDFGSFSMSISCDIEPQSGKELRVWRINDDATKTYATGVSYADGRVTFTADHLSIYAVGYEAGESQGGDEPEPVAYTLRILANDGSDSSSASAFTDTDASVVLPSSVQWAREGYSAAGFSTSSNGSGTVYALGRSLTISEAVALADQDRTVTLYVVWEQMQCSVTWAYDSGDVTVTVPYGTEIQKPEDAVREPTDTVSYEFAGWAGYKEGMKATADARFIPVFKSTVISYSDDDVEDSVLTVDTGADSVTVASGFVTKMKEASESGTITEVKFELEAGTIAFGSSSISEMSETQTVSMSLVSAEDLGSAVKVVTGGRPVFAIDFGGTETFTEPVKVSVSYALGEDESAEGLEVWYVRDDGTHEVLPCTYTEGRIVFETTHNSYYSVMYPGGDEPAEDDVPSGSSDNGLLVYAGIGVIAVAALVGAAVVLRRRG